MFREQYSLRLSRRVFDLLSDDVEYMNEDGYKLDCHLETFCKHKEQEQGYVLVVYDENNDLNRLYLWAFWDSHSDEIEIVCGKETASNNMFTDEEYKYAKHFYENQIYDAVNEFTEMLKVQCIKK